ncbi:MAG: TonB-dependent receptor [Ignavibacteriaceae bacterium]|nr:TonB-dependent receptor [Ignavibacteriaceae bacterium]MCW8823681.1 TonB-dependent receptor [Ignavibacteriaceae bacterium]MCW8960141.1 TonB-dependent receptor [Ignavibacteriaceae bacterium]
MNRITTVLLLLLLLPTLTLAGTTGKLKGKVTDNGTGEVLVGANVIVQGTSFGAATDINGDYTITNLDAGVYTVKCSYIGYQAFTVSNVRINADLTTELNFQLTAEGVQVGTVEVVALKPLLNKSNTNAQRITTADDIAALPVRGIENILALTPGVVLQDKSIYVRGGRQDEVGYYVEGTNVTNPYLGGTSLNFSQDALEEVSVQAGGYTAEFGGANAGIIRGQIKSGTPNWKASVEYITDNIGFQGSDQRFSGDKNWLGSYWYGYTDFIATVSGPIFTPKVKFFGLFENNFLNDQGPQPYPGINLGVVSDPNVTPFTEVDVTYPAGAVFKNSLQLYSGTGSLTFDFNPLLFRLVGSYSSTDTWEGNGYVDAANGQAGYSGNILRILDLDRIGKIDQTSGVFNLKMTHILNSNTYYELNGGYAFDTDHRYDPYLKDDFIGYGDSVANANVGWTWVRREGEPTGQYRTPSPYQVYTFSFNAPGDVISPYLRSKSENLNFSAAFSSQVTKEHSIKVGGELQTYTIRNFGITNRNVTPIAGRLNDPNRTQSYREIMTSLGVNNYGYDLEGNVYDGEDNYDTGQIGPKQPLFGGAYIQDKMEFQNLIINAGLRYDYINTDNISFINPLHPEESIDFNTQEVKPEGLVETPAFSSVSPRLGFSFPITDVTVFHAQYGKFVQQTRLRDIYLGMYAISFNLQGKFFIGTPVGYNVRPTRTTQYEIGFTQQIGDFASFDITGYYKDIQDQVVYRQQKTGSAGNPSPYPAYALLTNGDFATTKGVELSFNMRRVERFLINASLSFQDARGTGSYPNGQAGIVGAPLDGVTVFEPQYVTPLDYNKPFTGNLNIDYRFGKDDGGPILQELGASILFLFGSGHPYTTGEGKGNTQGSLEGDARFRAPTEPLNSSLTPSTFQVDLRVDKTVNLFDVLNMNLYVYVINLFDTKIVKNVFLRTGSPTDDGYLSQYDLGGQLAEQNGPDFVALYNAINIDYFQAYQRAGGQNQGASGSSFLWGPPRQIRFGIRLEY